MLWRCQQLLRPVVAAATWPLRHIGTKIIAPYALLTVALAILGAFLVTQLVAGSLRERFDNQLVEAGRVASDAVVRKEREHLESVRAMAFTEGVPEALQAGEPAELHTLLQPMAANEGVERLEVVDAKGSRMLGLTLSQSEEEADYETAAGDDPSDWWLVQQVLRGEPDDLGDKFAGLVETERGYVFFTAGPVWLDGQRVGAVLVGTYLDSFLQSAKTQVLADITIYDLQGQAIATTFAQSPQSPGEADLTLEPASLVSVAEPSQSAVRETRELWHRSYDLLYGQLHIRQSVVGLYSVGLPTNFILSAGMTTRLQLSIIFGLAMGLVLIIGWLVAGRITRPVRQLVRAAQAVGAGELSTRSGVSSRDEVGFLAASFDRMAESLEEYTEKLRRQHIGAIKALTSAIDARDPYTLGHSLRVGQLAVSLARRLGLREETVAEVEIGGYLHDIGKIGVTDAILLKPGALTRGEREIINSHPEMSIRILESVDLSGEALEFIRSHHERLDGSGYPEGRSGGGLSIIARIAAVSDMYDALTTDRPYRRAYTPEKAMGIMKSQAGTMLDRAVVEALDDVLPEWERRRRTDPTLRGFQPPEAVGQATIRRAA